MPTQIQLRRGTAIQWTTANPVLASGEIGAETDTGKFKVGNGVAAWSALPYTDTGGGASTLDDLTDVTITAGASGDILRHNGTAWVDAAGTTYFETAGAVASHESDTTSVHGITNTASLYVAGGTDVAVADGGTGASTDTAARTNLGLVIGTNVQAHSAVLTATTASFLIADETKLDGIEALAEVNDTAAEILTKLLTVDGAGSGLDADLLDGNSSAVFATASALSAHEADTTSIHGITNTALLLTGIRVEDEGTSTVASAVALNFVGSAVTVTDAGSNEATVTISGGSSDPLDANNIVATRIFAR